MRTRKEPALSYGEVLVGQSPGPEPWGSGSVCGGAWVAGASVNLCFCTQETVRRASVPSAWMGGWAGPILRAWPAP